MEEAYSDKAAVDYFKLLWPYYSFNYHVMEQHENQDPQAQETLIQLKNPLTWKLDAQRMILNVAISADAFVLHADRTGASAVLVIITAKSCNSTNIVYIHLYEEKNPGLSPPANYNDRATAACRRS
jgi:hypothetical protein